MLPTRHKALKSFASAHATPCFVLFPQIVEQNYAEFEKASQHLAARVHICYSVKTNPFPLILQTLHAAGAGMEVVSERELRDIASFSGVKLLNAPASSDEELRLALEQKACIIIDNLSQAHQLSALAKGKALDVGIRVRFDKHRFGFAPSELNSAIAELKKLKLNPILLHAHPGTSQTLNEYRHFLTQLNALLLDSSQAWKAIDLGGGLPGQETLRMRKQTIADYTALVKEILGDALKGKALYFELGRFLVEDAMCLLSRVQHVKEVDGKTYVLMDEGMFVLPKISMSPFRFSTFSESGKQKANVTLCGPSMFGSDEWAKVHTALARGDIVCVENVGAYCTELAWRLSRDVPPIHVLE